MHRDRGRHPLHHELVESAEHPYPRRLAIVAERDELGEHRVVVACDLPTLLDPRVDPHERTRRLPIPGDPAGAGEEVPARVFGVDAALDRRPARVRIKGQLLAERHPDLERDQVEAGHHLGHRVLHLEPGVHLEEVEVAVLVHHALDRAGVHVARLPREARGRLGEPFADPVVEQRRRRLLDQLLMPPLHRAVALAEEEHVAVSVGHDLGLDVVGPVDVALEEDLGPSEVGLRLARRSLQGLLQVVGVAHDMHALAASAEGSLHQEREADPGGLLLRLREVDGSAGPRHDRHAGRIGDAPRRGLVAHRLDRRRRWADERQPRVLDRLGERRPFRQESVPRVHERRLRLRGDLHDPVDRQVGRGRRAPVRSGTTRPPSPRGERPGPRRSRRRPSRCRGRGTSARSGSRSRRGWRSGASASAPCGATI